MRLTFDHTQENAYEGILIDDITLLSHLKSVTTPKEINIKEMLDKVYLNKPESVSMKDMIQKIGLLLGLYDDTHIIFFTMFLTNQVIPETIKAGIIFTILRAEDIIHGIEIACDVFREEGLLESEVAIAAISLLEIIRELEETENT